MRLEKWSVVDGLPPEGFAAPEVKPRCLNGRVFGHPKYEDGTEISTSFVLECQGRKVRTTSGSEYELGEPCPDYVAFCERYGWELKPEQPIKMIPSKEEAL